MKREDVIVEVRDRDLVRQGIITSKFLKLKATLRWCSVGSWTLTLPGAHPMVEKLSAEGSGIIVSLRNGTDAFGLATFATRFSGPTSSPGRKRDRQNPDGTFTFVGVTDDIHLADARAYPEPSNADPTTQTEANDTRSGNAETIMIEYVAENIVPGVAPAGRIRGAREHFAVASDLGRGDVVQRSPRFTTLLELLQSISVWSLGTSAPLGFRMIQRGSEIVFEVAPVVDRTDLVRLDIENGTITSEEVQKTGPTITYAIVAGQGVGVERQIVARTTAAAVAAESSWGRVIESFIDQRDTDVTLELEQSGDEHLAENGYTATAVKVIPSDDQTMRYGIDWLEGDRITVIVNGQETSTTVTEAALIVDESTVAVGAAIGNVTGFNTSDALTARVEDVEGRVGKLERNSEMGGGSWDALTGKPTTFPPTIGSGADEAVAGDDVRLSAATTSQAGVSELATNAETIAKTADDVALTPSNLAALHVSLFNGSVDGGSNITLSQAITDFRVLTIHYIDNDGNVSSVDIYVGDCVISTSSSTATNYLLNTQSGATTAYMKRRIIYFYSATSLRNVLTQYVAVNSTSWVNSSGMISITRVVGHY